MAASLFASRIVDRSESNTEAFVELSLINVNRILRWLAKTPIMIEILHARQLEEHLLINHFAPRVRRRFLAEDRQRRVAHNLWSAPLALVPHRPIDRRAPVSKGRRLV